MTKKKIALELDVNIKNADMTVEELSSQLENLGSTILEQKRILVEFERELIELQAIQSQTSKTDFARQSQLKAKTDELKEAIKDQRVSLRELSNERATATKSLKDLTSESANQGKIIAAVDKLTGGLATKTIKLYKGFGEGAKAVKQFAGGLSNMTKALVATGIGAFVVALGLVVAYWDDIKGAISGVSSEQKKLLANTEKKLKTNEENLAVTEASENSLKLQGKSEQDILDLKIKQTDEVIAATELLLEQQKETEKAQNAAAERNQKIAQGIIRFLTLPITILLATVDSLTMALSKIPGINIETNLEEGFSGGIANLIFDPEGVAKEGAETTKETEKQLLALKNKRDGFVIKGREDAQKEREKAAADRKKADDKEAQELDKKNKEEQRLEKEKQKALEEIRKGSIATEAQRRQDELDEIDKYYQSLIEAAEKYGKTTEDLEIAREAKKQELFDKEKARSDAKTLKEQEDLIKSLQYKQEQDENDFKFRREQLATREKTLLADKTLTDEQRNVLEKQFAAERINIANEEEASRRALAEQRLQIAGDILGAINGLAQAFAKDDEESQKKAFKLNKAAGIAQAIVSTAIGINNAFVNPADVASGFAFVKAATIGASGLAQIATISKTQFQGGGTPPPPPPTPGFNGGLQPRGFDPRGIDVPQNNSRVFVVETDITNTVNGVEGIYQRATVVE